MREAAIALRVAQLNVESEIVTRDAARATKVATTLASKLEEEATEAAKGEMKRAALERGKNIRLLTLESEALNDTPRSDWLVVGLAAFGLLLGGIMGTSETSGTAQAITSAVLTFVGGVVLTYAGFKRSKLKDAEVDPARTGKALTALAVGMIVGILGGVVLRKTPIFDGSTRGGSPDEFVASVTDVLGRTSQQDSSASVASAAPPAAEPARPAVAVASLTHAAKETAVPHDTDPGVTLHHGGETCDVVAPHISEDGVHYQFEADAPMDMQLLYQEFCPHRSVGACALVVATSRDAGADGGGPDWARVPRPTEVALRLFSQFCRTKVKA